LPLVSLRPARGKKEREMYEKKLAQDWIDAVTAHGSRDMLANTARFGLSEEDWEYHLDSLPEKDRLDVDLGKVNELVVAYCERRLAELRED
jgi:hypothetical protein